MHGIYNKLQEDCVTGPLMVVNGQKVARPFAEYPKWVTKADGSRVVVQSLREEAAMAGELAAPLANDPLAAEREALNAEQDKVKESLNELDKLKADMRAQLDELATARAALQGANVGKPAGSSFRLPKEAPAAPVVALAASEPEKA